jgi:arylsulfatase A-like enzyme/Flp pilus assembly protein TadD
MIRVSRSAAAFLVLIAGLLIPSAAASGTTAGQEKGRPNLLLITVDTLRADRLGCYGGREVKTPTIDALASRSVLFERAFAHTPLTLPSHTSILLGTTPPFHGVHDNSGFIVRDEFLTLAEWLKGRGYATGAFVGAFPLDSRFGLTQGFDVYDDDYGSQSRDEFVFVERKAEVVVDRAISWLKDRKGPWFAWVHCFDPHQPYQPPEPFSSQYKGSAYDGEVAYVDSALGKLMGFLKANGFESGTTVVLTADHGESLGEHGEMTHGYFAYNATLHVPLIIASPGLKPGRAAGNASHIDIFPTVCDALSVPKPAGLQGVSLWAAAKGKADPVQPIYFEALTAYYNRGWAPLRGTIEGNTKFMDSPIPELYDLEKDFHEQNNLAGAAGLGAHKKAFDELMKSQSSAGGAAAARKVDRDTSEKLRSLGYLASLQAPQKKTFTEADDLKTLLPFQNLWMQALSAYYGGKLDEAVRMLKEIISQRTDFDLAYTYLANLYKEKGRRNDAVDVLLEAYGNNPRSFRIMTSYGIALIDAGRNDEALDVLDKAVGIIDFDPEAWNYIGVAHWNKGELDAALKAYERALAIDNNYAIVFNNLGSLHLSEFLKGKRPELLSKAVANFRRAIELDPKYASAWNGLGAALKMSGDLDGALAAWKKAVELKPDFSYPLYNLGLILLSRGDKAQALIYFTKYKEGNYASLPLTDRQKLDALIQKCRQ